jgi:hypothetical protein
VPESDTVGAAPGALLLIVSVAARAPVADGVKVTLIVVLAPGATVFEAGVAAKSPGLAPLIGTPEIFSVELPVLVTVTTVAALVVLTSWLPKLMVVGAALIPGDVPVPVSAILNGLPLGTLLVKESVAERVPAAVGVNTTLIVVFWPGCTAMLWAPLGVGTNSDAFAPVTATFVIDSGA